MDSKIIDGNCLSGQIKSEIIDSVKRLKMETGRSPGLSVVLVGDDPASAIYVRNKQRGADEVGILGKTILMSHSSTENEVIRVVNELNSDSTCDGILVQLPLPDHIDEGRVTLSIDPLKDVDGLHPFNAGLLAAGKPRFVPATPGGIVQMLLRTGNDPSGKHVVILGRSNIVGRPISNLLSMKGQGGDATVTVCHSRTKNIEELCRSAEILIAAIGIPEYVTSNMVSDGVVAVDVGINRVGAPNRKRGYRLVGDIDFLGVSQKASAITPVPGGVGPMTIAMLLSNTLLAAQLH
ncbi:MAG: bifunctional 5,10-methylene-tetrahydrofolate dehydrogenase/5,10-methylene-tetrahydrofolate cyclohydrolase [Chloroflexi bacterium]|nr:bifunctional 5,10-methylene-tetrahydrofolate dehydrogenase/5,10-methylene-tetrahydrofolate cyclohydrolase [Chloroflexota bacterium]|tara:strand:+ start:128 stop:1006 length:879 start_codon:yes stop_codon:yes gene_type:complete